MFNKKTKLKLTDFECKLFINGMNEFRNMLLQDGIHTEDVDELFVVVFIRKEQNFTFVKNLCLNKIFPELVETFDL